MDSLWFVHAFNGAVLHLFGLDQRRDFLRQWTAWHVMATKFNSDSPVRMAHFNPDEYFPPTVALFFSDKRTYPYLFTAQMRCLIKRLDQLSEQSKLKFTQWWLQAISFDLEYDLDYLTRTIWYQGERIKTEAHPRMGTEVEVAPRQRVSYTLAFWDPIGKDAIDTFRAIRHMSDSHDIVYVADYDKQRDFHANNWQEVIEMIPQL